MDTSVRSNTVVTDSRCAVSWSAIAAGALVAFSLSVLFNLLNAGLGFVSFPESFHYANTLSVGATIWLTICGIIAMFIAGWIAGKVYRHFSPSACGGGLHGFLAWSLALLLTVFIAAHFASATAAASAVAAKDRTNVVRVDDNADAATREQAEEAADAAGKATLGIFFIFLLGAAAATVGGYLGAKKDSNYLDR